MTPIKELSYILGGKVLKQTGNTSPLKRYFLISTASNILTSPSKLTSALNFCSSFNSSP